jgi:hypothetical protein
VTAPCFVVSGYSLELYADCKWFRFSCAFHFPFILFGHLHRTWRSFSSSSPLMLPPELSLDIVWSIELATATISRLVPKLLIRFSSTSLPTPSRCVLMLSASGPLFVSCLKAPPHVQPAFAAARTNFTRRASTRAFKGSRIFQSANDDQKAVRALSHLLAYLPVAVADYRLPLLATVRQKHNNAVTATSPLTHTHSSSKPERTTTPPPETVSAASLISPPPTPQHKGDVDATMNCAPLHGAPTWGQAPSRGGLARGSQPAYGSKDSRGSPQPAFGNQRNFAVQPAVNSSNVRLKKATVKIVSAAPGTPSRATPAASPIPVPGPVKAKPKEPEQYV